MSALNSEMIDVAGGVTKVMAGASNTFAVLGDSVTQQNTTYEAPSASAATSIAFRNDGYMSWAVALSGQQIQFDPLNNYGVGGDILSGIATRVPLVLASGVGNCVVLAGHNDVTTAGTSYADMVSQLQGICETLIAGNVRVFLATLVPISGLDSTKRSKLASFNAWIRRYAATTRGVVLIDWWPYINDFTTTNFQQRPDFTRLTDTVHPGVKSAYLMGVITEAAIRPFIGGSGQTFVLGSQNDTFSATQGFQAALNANSAMKGTGGSKSATAGGATNSTITGDVADSFTVQKYGGAAFCDIVCSKETPRTDLNGLSNGSRQVIAFTTTQSGGGSTQIQMNMPDVTTASGAYAAGDVLFAECNIELINPVNMYGVVLLLTETHTNLQVGYALAYPGNSNNTANALMENTPRTYKLSYRTPLITAQPGSTKMVAQIQILLHPSIAPEGASGTIKVGDFAMRKAA